VGGTLLGNSENLYRKINLNIFGSKIVKIFAVQSLKNYTFQAIFEQMGQNLFKKYYTLVGVV
jgi:hypothetical protein